MSASHEFAAHAINAIPATTFAMVYNCATSLVSSELINIKRIEVKKRLSQSHFKILYGTSFKFLCVPLSTAVTRQLFHQRLFSSTSFITKSAPEYPSTLWCRALSRRYFCAKEFVSRKKKILKSSLVEMLLLPKGTDPLEDFSIGAILTEFFLCEPSNLATC